MSKKLVDVRFFFNFSTIKELLEQPFHPKYLTHKIIYWNLNLVFSYLLRPLHQNYLLRSLHILHPHIKVTSTKVVGGELQLLVSFKFSRITFSRDYTKIQLNEVPNPQLPIMVSWKFRLVKKFMLPLIYYITMQWFLKLQLM